MDSGIDPFKLLLAIDLFIYLTKTLTYIIYIILKNIL